MISGTLKENFLWINQAATLNEAAAKLDSTLPFAIDTEADSLHHYRESVCLVQLSQNGTHLIIDPLAQMPLDSLWKKLADATWILHGADFDLRMLRRIGAPEPSAVFDTMLAGQLLGYSAFGYAALVEQFFDIKLSKSNQRSDWSRRPLTPAMLQYAQQDTQYLEGLAEKMGALLKEANRDEWHRQSSARVTAISKTPRVADPENDWRIVGANLLEPGALAILKCLWQWRESEGERSDQPVFKIMLNEVLLKLATWADENRKLPPPAFSLWPQRISETRGKRLLEAIEQGRQAEPISRLPRSSRPSFDSAFYQRLEKLRVHRDKVSGELKLDSTLIASKNILMDLARDPVEAVPQLLRENRWCPWQAELMGESLRAV